MAAERDRGGHFKHLCKYQDESEQVLIIAFMNYVHLDFVILNYLISRDTKSADRLGHRDTKNENNLGHRDTENADKMLGHRDTKNANSLGHRDITNVEIKK